MNRTVWIGTIALTLLAGPVSAAKLIPVPMARTYVVPAAQLMRVDDGVFEVQIGKTIDLTDRKILLVMHCDDRKRCSVHLNGRSAASARNGKRIDLKREPSTRDSVKDKSVCILDVVDIAIPRGAPGVATFRIHCI